MQIYLDNQSSRPAVVLDDIAARWQLSHDPDALLSLTLTDSGLQLIKRDELRLSGVQVDFISGALAHRRRFGGGRGEAIAKAVGIKGDYLPDVVDGTAGLGRDAFVLACLGCRVRMIERHPVVAALLEDGLQRAYQDAELGALLQDKLTLIYGHSQQYLQAITPRPDVVYLDPMYPHKQKRALVKKEMRLLQLLVGADSDAEQLLTPARQLAKRRVIVKRPHYAEPLMVLNTTSAVTTKNHRFDIYPPLIVTG